MANGIPDTIEPINPTIRERVRQGIFDLLSRDNQDQLTRQRNLRRAESLAGVLDFIPGYGESADISDARQAFGDQRYGSGLLSLGTAALGAVPVVGDAAAGAVRKGVRAYHGSPYTFDRFDLSKIGTGEGAQAYGHGLYFADNENVAREYRDQLSDPYIAQKKLEKAGGNIDQAITNAQEWIKKYREGGADSYADAVEDELRMLENFKNTGEWAKGSMYEVNLNVDPQGLLDWDKPLSEQPNVVRALRNISDTPYEESSMFRQLQDRGFAPEQIENYRQAYNDRVSLVKDSLQDFELGTTRGDTVVRLLERLGAENNAEASRMLREQGILGIRYLDGMSRGAGEGSSNYVIFDDNLIELMRRYGIALPTGLLGYGMVRGQNNEAQ